MIFFFGHPYLHFFGDVQFARKVDLRLMTDANGLVQNVNIFGLDFDEDIVHHSQYWH